MQPAAARRVSVAGGHLPRCVILDDALRHRLRRRALHLAARRSKRVEIHYSDRLPGPMTMSIPELMTLEEVAKYLRVSDRTVYEWAQKGEIPAGKLGGSWRFKRAEIKKWVEDRLTPGSAKKIHSIDLNNVLSLDRIKIMSAKDKTEALNTLIDLLVTAPEVKSRDELADAIFRREKLMSTGIGLGIGLPHVRLASVSNVVMAIGINRTDITDYQSLDGQPVRIICMIAAGKYQHTTYLKTLVAISPYLRTEKIRQALLQASDPKSVADLFLKGGTGL